VNLVSHWLVALFVAACALCTPFELGAQPPDPSTLSDEQRDELGRLFTRARGAYESGNFLEAIALLEKAHAIFPDPSILYRIGDAYESAGDLGKAIAAYRDYLEAAVDATDRGIVTRRIEDLERRVAQAAQSVAETTARAVVASGERIRPERTAEVVVAPVPRSRKAAWVLGGVGAVSIVGAAGSYAVSRVAAAQIGRWDAEREAAHATDDPVPPRPAQYDSTFARSVVARNAAFVALGVGFVALTASVGWFALTPSDRVALRLAPRGAVVTVRW